MGSTPRFLVARSRKMEGQNIVHVIDSVLMPEGYDMYQDYYDSITRCAQLMQGTSVVVDGGLAGTDTSTSGTGTGTD